VIGLISGSASGAARALGHKISLALNIAVLGALNVYMFYCAIKKRKGKRYQFIPFLLTFFALFLICADLMRHVLADQGVWHPGPFPGSSQYRPGCKHQTVACLSLTGVLFTIVCTYTGFICLFTGSLWNANILTKLKQLRVKWIEIRALNHKH